MPVIGMRPEDTDWDVVVAGAGSTGLSAAAHLTMRVLVLGSEPVGAVQRSACRAPAEVFEGLGLQDAVLQAHHNFWLHSGTDDRLTRSEEHEMHAEFAKDYERYAAMTPRFIPRLRRESQMEV